MKEKIKKRRESLEMMEEQILKGVNIEDVTEETRALYKIKFRKEQGAEAINKLHSEYKLTIWTWKNTVGFIF